MWAEHCLAKNMVKRSKGQLRDVLTGEGTRIVSKAGRPSESDKSKPELMIFQEVMVRLLKANNCSQNEFAHKYGIDGNVIRQACSATNIPGRVNAQRLVNALYSYTSGIFDITVEELYDLTDPKFRDLPYKSKAQARDKTNTIQKAWEMVERFERSFDLSVSESNTSTSNG